MIIGGILFILGLIVGSFVNSFLWRYATKNTYAGRSICPKCKKQIKWYDNIPIISWFLLSGKCRYCKKSISIQYPLVEGLAGIVFLLIGLFSTPAVALNRVVSTGSGGIQGVDLASLSALLFVAGILITITVYDVKTREIPNGFNLIFAASGAIYSLSQVPANPNPLLFIIYHIASAVGAFLFFYAFVFFSKETWMGGGDAKLAFGIGLLLGPAGTFLAILLASWLGALYGIGLMILRKATAKTAVPFGPFLALGTFVSLLFGSQLIDWYAKIFLKV